MLPELGMNTNDFNYGQTIFLVSFLAAELPSGLISKKLGPDVWIPFIITAWSIVSAAQAGLKNRAGYFAVRCLLGLLMGGFIPDVSINPVPEADIADLMFADCALLDILLQSSGAAN